MGILFRDGHQTHWLFVCVSYVVYRKNKKRKGRESEGILVYYKKELKNILTFLEKSSENILWVKITKVYTHADREVYLAGIYNSPNHSNYTKENNCNVIDIIRERLSKFSSSELYRRRF